MQKNRSDFDRHVAQASAALEPRLIALRRDLHRHPELAFQEHRTAARLVAELEAAGLQPRGGVGGTGVVVDIDGGAPGPCILLRADIDALPIHEATGLPFASETPGVMHACGHDLHAAIGAGTALVMAGIAPRLHGRLRIVFQPAEEILEGAQAMIDDGVLDGVDMAIGFHNKPDLPVGRFGMVHGATTASSDRFVVTVRGQGGHTARMHQTRSPIPAVASLALALPALVPALADPAVPAILGLGMIQAGHSHNVVPDTASLSGTLRTRSETVRNTLQAAIARQCRALALAHDVECALDYRRGVCAQVNDAALFVPVRAALRARFGDVIDELPPSMGAEDFALFSDAVPGFRFHIGSGQPGRSDRVHAPDYQPDEGSIRLGVEACCGILLELLARA
ncbi:amidohydrolase (plasmid) [Paracoccus yeei]|uniref:M20 metallopeptidase family protein n=1 Tax=Paracoccus yeei TaxID=147645 RepID=UPI003BF81A33